MTSYLNYTRLKGHNLAKDIYRLLAEDGYIYKTYDKRTYLHENYITYSGKVKGDPSILSKCCRMIRAEFPQVTIIKGDIHSPGCPEYGQRLIASLEYADAVASIFVND